MPSHQEPQSPRLQICSSPTSGNPFQGFTGSLEGANTLGSRWDMRMKPRPGYM